MKGADKVQLAIDRLTKNDIRLTPQRISVYSYILDNHTHPTIDNIYSAIKNETPSLSKTTIYNIVDVLLKATLVKVVRITDGDVRLDSNICDHGHFHCLKCEKITDVTIENFQLPEAFNTYRVDSFEIKVEGVCENCIRPAKTI